MCLIVKRFNGCYYCFTEKPFPPIVSEIAREKFKAASPKRFCSGRTRARFSRRIVMTMRRFAVVALVLIGFLAASRSFAQPGNLKILTNHLGYESTGPKHAVILGSAADRVSGCEVAEYPTG